MRKILALCLTALMMLSIVAPVMAADETNVALGATVTAVGFLEVGAGTKESVDVLVDGEYNTDVDYNAGNWGGKHAAFVTRYNADGETTTLESYKEPPYVEGFPYYSLITLELKSAADLTKFRVVMADPDFGIGEFTIQEWDILVSETGKPGSWKVAYEARATRENEEWQYEESEDVMYPYWYHDAELKDAKNVKYVALGITMLCNHNDLGKGQYVNLLELEAYGTAVGGAATEDTTPVTEDTTPVTEDTTPVTEDTTPVTEDTTPVTQEQPTETPDAPETFDFVIVPAIALAAAAAGVVVLKKKEN